MTLEIPEEVLKTLAEPDAKGVVRTTVALRINQDGGADVVEINDMPVPNDGEEEGEQSPDSETSEQPAPMPSSRDIAAQISAA